MEDVNRILQSMGSPLEEFNLPSIGCDREVSSEKNPPGFRVREELDQTGDVIAMTEI